MIPVSQEFKDAVTSSISTLHARIELLGADETVVQQVERKVIDGSLSVDMEQDVQRHFNLTLDNRDGSFTWKPNGDVWLDKRVKIYVGVETRSGIHWAAQGVFLLTSPVATSSWDGLHTAQLQGGDKWRLHDGDPLGKFSVSTTIQKGTPIAAAIRALATDNGETKFAFDACDATVPYDLSYTAGESRGKAMKELAEMAVYRLYYDVDGYLRFQPYNENLALRASEWTYDTEDERTLYAGADKVLDETQTFNRVLVVGGSMQTAGVSAVAEITDVASPLHKSKIGVRQTEWNGGSPDPLISTQALAQARADWELIKYSKYAERHRFRAIPHFMHDAGDVITIRDKYTDTDGKYELLRFNVPLRPGDYMHAEAWSVKKVEVKF